ncbi:MAG TPA: DEAD/DEAH box helicase, partial [Bdellovibrionota bacterium]|nr:DEAD/DEAH box helicase [Bdellovibrionota bacterium]
NDVRKIADEYLREPARVKVNQAAVVPAAIEQIYYRTREDDKPEIVCKLIDAAPEFYGIIFCQTKALVADLTQYLKSRSYAVDCLHGDMTQDARDRTMKSFRDRRVKLLVCTDVASRGIDVKDITHVINYSLPRELENYVHRIGRTARSGKTGFALNLVTPSHRPLIPKIEAVTKSKMREGTLPTRKEIGSKKISAVIEKFQSQESFARAMELMDDQWKEALEGMDGMEIAARFLAMNFPEVFEDRSVVKGEAARPGVVRGNVVRSNVERSPSARPSAFRPRPSTNPTQLVKPNGAPAIRASESREPEHRAPESPWKSRSVVQPWGRPQRFEAKTERKAERKPERRAEHKTEHKTERPPGHLNRKERRERQFGGKARSVAQA